MGKGAANTQKIKREERDLASLLESLPLNPIPWAVVVRLVAPIVARLAVRYALKRLRRGMSEEKVNTIGRNTADFVAGIVERRLDLPGGPG